MDPTPEQQLAIDAFATGDSLAIEAGAGTGKTSTLVMIAKTGGKRNGQYVAFNKSLVSDAASKFPLSVTCNTAHSLAFRAVGKHYKPRLDHSARMFGRDIASRLQEYEPLEVTTFDNKSKSLTAGFLASLAVRTVTTFCQSADLEITRRHVPFQDGLDHLGLSQMLIAERVAPMARRLWADLQNEYGWVPFKHEHYLKMWQLRNPVIAADFILFDEAQDANPVIASIIAAQAGHCQLVYVGDSQQEIYAWTGAVNALARIDAVHRTYLTQSFRFGQAIADRANAVLATLDSPLRLTGNPAIESRVGEVDTPRAILTRTNALGVTNLLALQESGRKAHLIGGGADVISFAEGAEQLQLTGHSGHPDLALFDSWAAVQQYVKEEAGGEDLRLFVRLIDTFGASAIRAGLERMPTEKAADIVISTAHKSKGREWSSVKLTNDFPQQADSDAPDRRLLYVALTRAQFELDDTALSPADEGLEVVQ